MVAAVLLLVQAFLAGLTAAQAALVMTGRGDFAVICHGNGGVASDPGTLPGSPAKQHACCDSCTAGAPPALLPLPALALHDALGRTVGSPAWRAIAIPLAARAVRAGPSQAPPSLD